MSTMLDHFQDIASRTANQEHQIVKDRKPPPPSRTPQDSPAAHHTRRFSPQTDPIGRVTQWQQQSATYDASKHPLRVPENRHNEAFVVATFPPDYTPYIPPLEPSTPAAVARPPTGLGYRPGLARNRRGRGCSPRRSPYPPVQEGPAVTRAQLPDAGTSGSVAADQTPRSQRPNRPETRLCLSPPATLPPLRYVWVFDGNGGWVLQRECGGE